MAVYQAFLSVVTASSLISLLYLVVYCNANTISWKQISSYIQSSVKLWLLSTRL